MRGYVLSYSLAISLLSTAYFWWICVFKAEGVPTSFTIFITFWLACSIAGIAAYITEGRKS